MDIDSQTPAVGASGQDTAQEPKVPTAGKRCVAWTEDYHRCASTRSGRLVCSEHRKRRWWIPRVTFILLAIPSCWWFVEVFFDKSRLQAENLALTRGIKDAILTQNVQAEDRNRELEEFRRAQAKIEELRGVLSRIDNIQIPRISASNVFEASQLPFHVRGPVVGLYVEGGNQYIARLRDTMREVRGIWTDAPSRKSSEDVAQTAIRDATIFFAYFEATAQATDPLRLPNPPNGLEPIALPPSPIQPPKDLQQLAEAEARVARADKAVKAHIEQGILHFIPKPPQAAHK